MIFLKHKHDYSPLNITGVGMLPLGTSPSPLVWHSSPWQLMPADLSACIVHLLLAPTHTHITHLSAHTFIHITHKNTHIHTLSHNSKQSHTPHTVHFHVLIALTLSHIPNSLKAHIPHAHTHTHSHIHLYHTPQSHTCPTHCRHMPHNTHTHHTIHCTLGSHTLAHHIHMLAHMC